MQQKKPVHGDQPGRVDAITRNSHRLDRNPSHRGIIPGKPVSACFRGAGEGFVFVADPPDGVADADGLQARESSGFVFLNQGVFRFRCGADSVACRRSTGRPECSAIGRDRDGFA